MKPTLAIVGAGKVGAALSRLLFARGYTVTTVYSRAYSHAEALARMVDARIVEATGDVQGDLVLLTVPDDAIEATAAALAGFSGRAVVHTSGVHDATALALLADQGVQVGSLHPVYPFTDMNVADTGVSGAVFGIEASGEPLLGWLLDIVAALDGQTMMIPPGGKALYHTALAMVSGYTVTLYAIAEMLLTGLGIEQPAADQALNMLLAGTVDNLRVQGIPDALPGPLARSDVGTIAAHLRALHRVDDQLVEAYRLLGRLTYPLLRARGIAPEAVEQIFEQDVEHAHHSP